MSGIVVSQFILVSTFGACT
ncbi:hypothetical protein [Vibrio parahaemolyticus]|nr:hypothetical protein [Vibrio parahaemolyticus]MCG6459859.1 hypothetical protein [Vibrio parahaemolyticus]MCR9665597.1 hypothetical protein [Vibrio parahaemolyticus]MCR9669599.1 hypothetical protein [Vibrio parahaemolyticus]MCR9678853.1 hypothetical protein [Vibrio parahaemolyticus]MCR9826079.1 hypothetical protein [Vibrio parahaemolyticus]